VHPAMLGPYTVFAVDCSYIKYYFLTINIEVNRSTYKLGVSGEGIKHTKLGSYVRYDICQIKL
jgi:hypothetical protein